MNVKWFFTSLVVVLTFFGFNQEQIDVPNQEIVLQFTNSVSSAQTKSTIANVKQQLQTVGASNIQIAQQDNGQLNITYYSAADVVSVKQVLSKESSLTAVESNDKNKEPSKDNTNHYNLNVYEIQSNTDSDSGIAGKFILKLNQDYDRFVNPNIHPYAEDAQVDAINNSVKTAYKINTTIAIAIDNRSYKIPEVRAGPLA